MEKAAACGVSAYERRGQKGTCQREADAHAAFSRDKRLTKQAHAATVCLEMLRNSFLRVMNVSNHSNGQRTNGNGNRAKRAELTTATPSHSLRHASRTAAPRPRRSRKVVPDCGTTYNFYSSSEHQERYI